MTNFYNTHQKDFGGGLKPVSVGGDGCKVFFLLP